MLSDLTVKVLAFRDDRDWKQFHSPKNLAASISIEAAELLEIFQWSNDSEVAEVVHSRAAEIEEELADVLIYCLLLAHESGVDLEKAALAKLARNAEKYPVSRSRGSSAKYDAL